MIGQQLLGLLLAGVFRLRKHMHQNLVSRVGRGGDEARNTARMTRLPPGLTAKVFSRSFGPSAARRLV